MHIVTFLKGGLNLYFIQILRRLIPKVSFINLDNIYRTGTPQGHIDAYLCFMNYFANNQLFIHQYPFSFYSVKLIYFSYTLKSMNLVENILDKHNPDFFLCQGCQIYFDKKNRPISYRNSSKKYVYYSENSTLTTTRVVASLNNK